MTRAKIFGNGDFPSKDYKKKNSAKAYKYQMKLVRRFKELKGDKDAMKFQFRLEGKDAETLEQMYLLPFQEVLEIVGMTKTKTRKSKKIKKIEPETLEVSESIVRKIYQLPKRVKVLEYLLKNKYSTQKEIRQAIKATNTQYYFKPLRQIGLLKTQNINNKVHYYIDLVVYEEVLAIKKDLGI